MLDIGKKLTYHWYTFRGAGQIVVNAATIENSYYYRYKYGYGSIESDKSSSN